MVKLNSKFVGLLLVILSLFCSLFMPTLSYAAGNYGIFKTPSIYIGGTSNAGTCSTQDVSTNWTDFMSQDINNPLSYRNTWNYISGYDNARQTLDAFHDEFVANVATGSGWAVSRTDPNVYGAGIAVSLYTFSPSSELNVVQNGISTSTPYFRSVSFGLNPNVGCRFQAFDYKNTLNFTIYVSESYPLFFVASDDINYPADYTGEPIPTSNEWADLDGDGLIADQEATQSTSNANKDTDGDGLNDYIESQWYPNRSAVFCGTSCAYPNPTQKDVYLQIDWMKNSSNQTFKPTSAQLSLVEDMYADKGINFHADTGQYGGGNELATYTHSLRRVAAAGQVDFWDYKNGGDGIVANFASDRSLIWRYMIYGYEYYDSEGTSSGWSEVMGDDIFISGGWIENLSELTSVDRAIANTMAHETGHALCLSNQQIFAEQPTECIYDGIDNDDENDPEHDLVNYKSVMNYRYQLTDQDDLGAVDYSDGSHGTGDFNDWGGVLTGMDGFSGTKTLLGAKDRYYITPDGDVMIVETVTGNSTQKNKIDDPAEVLQGDLNGQQSTGNPARRVDTNEASKRKQAEIKNDWVSISVTVLMGIAMAGLLTLGVIWLIKERRN
ncbi:hypothetical protein PV379_04675 [Streptomyces caniscabiei]|uniref:hypothetical protein n=1 Tax=Streptomyces caniscabiei TaxID=2746961 RepID=UPI0029A2DD17|nr:hypothetical protein [Streptomyces caniscabiei]MDX2776627.1 hypothetical protein [Streptomyces caniscabiei]